MDWRVAVRRKLPGAMPSISGIMRSLGIAVICDSKSQYANMRKPQVRGHYVHQLLNCVDAQVEAKKQSRTPSSMMLRGTR
jgi:hypothetical protein